MRFRILRWVGLVVALASTSAGADVVTRGDVEALALRATSQPGEGGINALATEMCGLPVDMLGAAPNDRAPRATVASWLPALPSEGEATVHLSGVGYSQLTKRPISGPCQGTITFTYRFRRVERGDNIVGFHVDLDSEFTRAPKLVPEKKRPAVDRVGLPPPLGTLDVSTDAACTLRVDGTLEGNADPSAHKTVGVAPGAHLLTCTSLRVGGLLASVAKSVEAGNRAAVALSLAALEKAADGGSASAPAKGTPAADTMIDRGSGVLEQVSSGLRWTRNDNGADVTWDGASAYCNQLPTPGGGWRLPSSLELQSVYDEVRLKGGVPCGDAYCNKSMLALTSWWFWTAEKRDAAVAWTFIFQQGYGFPYSYPVGASAGSRALCVRSPRAEEVDTLASRVKAAEEAALRAPAVEAKEIDRGGGVLEQVATGLQWTGADNGRDINWNDARRYCDHLPLSGGAWRLPTMDELRNLYSDAVGTKAAPCGTYVCGVPPGFSLTSHWFWTSDSNGPGKGQGFGFDTAFPGTGPVGYSYHARVLCVRHR